MTAKKKMLILSVIFLLLMCACLALGWQGLEKVYNAQKEAKVAFALNKDLQDLMISYEHIVMVVHDYIILGDQDEKQTYKVKYDDILAEKENITHLIDKEKKNHCNEFQVTLGEIQNLFPEMEKDSLQFESTVSEIFSINEPFGDPQVGALMKKLDSITKKIVTRLESRTLELRDLFEHALMESHKNHLFINIALIVLGLISFVIGFIVSQYMIKVL
ncbi:MAG: hypothetical protein ACMUHX_08810 [bacterium]